MINLLKLEIYKLKHNKSFCLIALAVIVCEIFYVTNNGSLVGVEAFRHSMYDVSTTMLLGAILTGLFVGNDFATRIINQEVTAGHSRLKILISKSVVFYCSVEMITILYPISSVCINTAFNGWGEEVTVFTFVYIIRTVLLRFIIDAGCTSLWILIAFVFKDIGRTIGISVIIFMIGIGALTALSEKSSVAKCLYKLTANSQARTIVNDVLTTSSIINICLVNLLIVFIFMSISYIVFRKAELK